MQFRGVRIRTPRFSCPIFNGGSVPFVRPPSLDEIIFIKELEGVSNRQDFDSPLFCTIDDAETAVNDLAQVGTLELGNLPAAIGKCGEAFNHGEDLVNQAFRGCRTIGRNPAGNLRHALNGQR